MHQEETTNLHVEEEQGTLFIRVSVVETIREVLSTDCVRKDIATVRESAVWSALSLKESSVAGE